MALAVLLGGNGFVGRALAGRLQADGWAVRVCARHPARAALPDGVGVRACDVRIAAQLRPALADADAVVYLPGIVRERGGDGFRALHVTAPQAAAELARAAGARHFVYLSALGVAADSPAAADRSKIAGEAAVRAAFPGAHVVRPSLVAGPDDHFVAATAQLLRALPLYPLPALGATRVQPLHVDDLATALAALLAGTGTADADPRPDACTWELGGPDTCTLLDLTVAIRDRLGLTTPILPLPTWSSLLLARAAALLPGAPLVPEQVRLLRTDKTVAAGAHGFAELGLQPRGLAACLDAALPQSG
jgi:NADH dehydrogenase